MKKIQTYQGAVMTWECDSNRHMNVMYYVNKFEHAGRLFAHHMGFEGLGKDEQLGFVALEQVITYEREVFEDDLLFIQSSLVDIGNKAFTIFHEMYNYQGEQRVATMKVTLVLFDKVKRKALPFPSEKKEGLLNK